MPAGMEAIDRMSTDEKVNDGRDSMRIAALMRKAVRFATIVFFATALRALAEPIAAEEAVIAVQNWIALKDTMDAQFDVSVSNVASFAVGNSPKMIHAINLNGGGYVLMSGDDRLWPVIAFSDSGEWVASDENPLWAIIRRDVSNRVATVENVYRKTRQLAASALSASGGAVQDAVVRNKTKWNSLMSSGKAFGKSGKVMLKSASGMSSISDVRVSPLVKSTWDQGYVIKSGIFSDTKYPCYNYFTPKRYPCGCVATAMAQIMRYHKYPTDYVTPKSEWCFVDDVYTNLTMKGGYYDWSNMPLSPTYSTSDEKRQAIGKLTYDAGVSVGMMYASSESGAYMSVVSSALTNTFGYANAVDGWSCDCDVTMANLDAGYPVVWGISGSGGGHAVVVDGYGYSSEMLYVHVNLGWGGSSNAWYNPDDGITSSFDCVDTIIADIFPYESDKVVVSGRVLTEANAPIEDAIVYCNAVDGSISLQAATNEKGIWSMLVPKSEELDFAVYCTHNGYAYHVSENDKYFYKSTSGIDFTIPELAEAVDYEWSARGWDSVRFCTGTAAPWIRQGAYSVRDEDAAQSAMIGHSSESWMEASAYGDGKLTFWWNVSSEPDYDKLHFSIDGEEVASISGTNNEWRCETFIITNTWGSDTWESGEHAFRWSYTKDKAVVGGLDCGWVDNVTWQEAVSIYFCSDDWEHSPTYHISTNVTMYVGDEYGELPKPTRTGYTFIGWYRQECNWDAAIEAYIYATNWLSSSDVVQAADGYSMFHAAWNPNTYFILFDPDFPEENISAQRCTYDRPEALFRGMFRREGYEFRGWSTSPGGRVEFSDEAIVTNLTSQNYGAVVLYAIWHPATRTTAVPVPHDWLEKYGLVENGDYEAAANKILGKTCANGEPQPAWCDWLAGTDPTDPHSRLTVQIEFVNGSPVVSWEPCLDDRRRVYTVLGKENLDDEKWIPVDSAPDRSFQFFKVSIDFAP